MLNEHARGARSRRERMRGASARLAMLVAALVLAIGSCGLADPATKSRTDSMRGAAWPGAEAAEGALRSVAVVHTRTPSPEPTTSPSSFFGAFEQLDGAQEPANGSGPQAPDRIFWPLPAPDAPDAPDEPDYEELGHSPEPDPGSDPCDAVGVLPDECDPEPEPGPSPCDDSAESCDPPVCDGAGDGEPTSEPTDPDDGSGTGGDGGQTPEPTGSPDPTPTPDPTPSPSPSEPPDDGEPGC